MNANPNAGELAGRHIVLGLSGGVACYKAAELCRGLVKAGATVQVVMTEAAEQFITPVTMQALSGRPSTPRSGMRGRQQHGAHQPQPRGRRHPDRAGQRRLHRALAQGRADELLSLLCLARPIERVPLLLAPAMNREMWAHPATQRNVAQVQPTARRCWAWPTATRPAARPATAACWRPTSCWRS
jgi:phosphopantothenoylcysteine decarboxylase/phosphopantothenate--cysteine ligase